GRPPPRSRPRPRPPLPRPSRSARPPRRRPGPARGTRNARSPAIRRSRARCARRDRRAIRARAPSDPLTARAKIAPPPQREGDAVEDLAHTVGKLQASEEIRHLKARYARVCDTGYKPE